MENFKNIILYSSIGLLSLCIFALIISKQYGSAVALGGIFVTIFVPFFTKNLELEKHRQQLLFEKKYNAYAKYLERFDDFYHSSSRTIVELEKFNKKRHESKEEFEKHKQEVLEMLKKFFNIQDYLSMPGIEILIFTNEEIQEKINEIAAIKDNIKTDDSITNNLERLKIYIQILSELSKLLQKDLKIEINN